MKMVEDYVHIDLSNLSSSPSSFSFKTEKHDDACYYCRFTDDRCKRCAKRFHTRSLMFMCQFLVMVAILFAAQYVYDKTA